MYIGERMRLLMLLLSVRADTMKALSWGLRQLKFVLEMIRKEAAGSLVTPACSIDFPNVYAVD
jgi:hypothetical protein